MTAGSPPVVIRASSYVDYPWKNGKGLSRLVASSDDTPDPAWRISIARITTDAEFSAFPGIDRSLMALSTDELSLCIAGTRITLGQHEVATFSGEEPVAAVDIATPSLDLNLMVRRRTHRGSLRSARVDGTSVESTGSNAIGALVALRTGLSIGSTELGDLDAVLLGPLTTLRLVGRGRMAVISIVER